LWYCWACMQPKLLCTPKKSPRYTLLPTSKSCCAVLGMLYCAVSCCTVLRCAVLCRTLLRCAVLCCVKLCCIYSCVKSPRYTLFPTSKSCCAVLCRVVLCWVVMCILSCSQMVHAKVFWRHAVLCCAVLCCAVLCCAVPRCAVPCCAVPCCAVPCCAVLCCVMLCVRSCPQVVCTMVFWRYPLAST